MESTLSVEHHIIAPRDLGEAGYERRHSTVQIRVSVTSRLITPIYREVPLRDRKKTTLKGEYSHVLLESQ